MKAYAVTIGFDNNTTETIQKYIDSIAKATQNDYMISNSIEPHITIGAFYAENDQAIIDILDIEAQQLKPDTVFLKKIESFYPNVVYISPEKDSFLSALNHTIHDRLSGLFVAADHEYYTPQNWVPHCALAVQLNDRQYKIAISEASKIELPFLATAKQINLAECLPYRRIKTWKL